MFIFHTVYKNICIVAPALFFNTKNQNCVFLFFNNENKKIINCGGCDWKKFSFMLFLIKTLHNVCVNHYLE